MADSDPSPPERSDLDFDLDFDLGEIDFEEEPAPAPAETPSEDLLSRDLASLLGGSGGAANRPRSGADKVAAEDPEDEPEIEEEPDEDPDPEPAQSPEAEQGDETDAVIDEPPTAEDDDLIEDVLDELDIDEEQEVDVDDSPPADQIDRPDDSPEIDEDDIPDTEPEADELVDRIDEDNQTDIDADLSEPEESNAALAAARRRRERRRPTAPSEAPLGEDEFEVVFDDDGLDAVKEDQLVVDIEDEIEPALDDDFEEDGQEESTEPVLASDAEPSDDLVDDDELDIDLDLDELREDIERDVAGLDDDLDADLDEIVEPVVASAPEEVEPAITHEAADVAPVPDDDLEDLEIADLDEITADLEDDFEEKLSFEPRAAEGDLPLQEVGAALTPELEDDIDDLDDADGDDALAAAVEEIDEPERDDLGLPEDVTALSEDDLIDDELSGEIEEDEIALATTAPPPPPDAKTEDEFEDEFEPALESEDDSEFDAAFDDDLAEEKATSGKLFAFKPLELAGLAAVVAVCIGGLLMLTSNVSGVLRDARSSVEEISKRVPKALSGDSVEIGSIECYWRDRQEDDRADEFSTILPQVVLGEPSGTGFIQVLFRDAEGTIRGDGIHLQVKGGAFVDNGAEVAAFCTDGLTNEAQFAYYRSDAQTAQDDRWNVTIRESQDGENWAKLAVFEIPPERRRSSGD